MERIKLTKPPEIPQNMTPSPTMRVRFGNGEVVQISRRERRRLHLYGDRIKRSRRQ